MSSAYPVLDNRPIDQWKVTELKEELRRRKLITKGLKDDLIKRLDEAICNEIENAEGRFDKGLECAPISVIQSKDPETVPVVAENAETVEDITNHGININENVDGDMLQVDINDISRSLDGEKFLEGELIGNSDSAGEGGQQVVEAASVETNVTVSESVVSEIAFMGVQNNDIKNDSGDSEALLLNDDSKSPQASDPNHQVSEVSPVLGFEVKCDSISSDSVSINAKNELKDNVIADDVKLELDVKHDIVQPSSINFVPDSGRSHSMDVEEPHQKMVRAEDTSDYNAENADIGKENNSVEKPHENKKVYAEDTSGNNAENADIGKKNDIEDVGSSEKLKLDRSSGEDSMEEDVFEIKQIDSKFSSDAVGDVVDKIEVSVVEEEGPVHVIAEDLPVGKKSPDVEIMKDPVVPPVKRKLHDEQTLGNNEATKRQRRWNSEGLRVPETQSSNVAISTTPRDAFPPTTRSSFERSNSTLSDEKPKERAVPPSSKLPTNSLRIDRFLRPFTLKAVQDLLGKTGTVTSFWMDHIKTHCFVTYSSVEEAVETRNAVYDLQWPLNGGRHLVADYVDPEEVKMRVEAPPQSPVTPRSTTGPTFLPTPPTVQAQPSPRLQVQRQQLPPALPVPPPPPLANPPPVRERITLPPPPPLPEKIVDPPIIITLDDLFRKTKATPRIYYLPLSDGEVAAKLRAQGKNGNQ